MGGAGNDKCSGDEKPYTRKSEAISYLSRASLFIRLNLAIKTFGRFDAEAAFCIFCHQRRRVQLG